MCSRVASYAPRLAPPISTISFHPCVASISRPPFRDSFVRFRLSFAYDRDCAIRSNYPLVHLSRSRYVKFRIGVNHQPSERAIRRKRDDIINFREISDELISKAFQVEPIETSRYSID